MQVAAVQSIISLTGVADLRYDTKSVEYRLHIRKGKRQEAKGRINNQFLITRFSIIIDTF